MSQPAIRWDAKDAPINRFVIISICKFPGQVFPLPVPVLLAYAYPCDSMLSTLYEGIHAKDSLSVLPVARSMGILLPTFLTDECNTDLRIF